MTQPNKLLTVSQFANKHTAFTVSGLRWLIFKAKPRYSSKGLIQPNGLEDAIVRIGRRVLIDEDKFFTWVEDKNSPGSNKHPNNVAMNLIPQTNKTYSAKLS